MHRIPAATNVRRPQEYACRKSNQCAITNPVASWQHDALWWGFNRVRWHSWTPIERRTWPIRRKRPLWVIPTRVKQRVGITVVVALLLQRACALERSFGAYVVEIQTLLCQRIGFTCLATRLENFQYSQLLAEQFGRPFLFFAACRRRRNHLDRNS